MSFAFFARPVLALILALAWGHRAAGQLATAPQLPRAAARAAGFDPGKLAAVDAILKRGVSERQIAGASALVLRRGKIVGQFAAGMQDAEAERQFQNTRSFALPP